MAALGTTLATTHRYRWRLRGSSTDPRVATPALFYDTRFTQLFGDSRRPTDDGPLLKLLPEPSTFKDIGPAVARILAALDAKESITIFGDYDVDGTTSCAMLRRFFAEIGHPVSVYIPERLLEGYGLNPIGLAKVKEAGGSLVITVDNGIAAVDACRRARELGLDVIITDHHDLPPVLPEALAIINPKQTDCRFPFRMLAGVGVAFYLMVAVRAALRERSPDRVRHINLRESLDFVAIGTIADMAPLDGVNHVLCKVGLEVMSEHLQKGSRPGLDKLLRLAGWDGRAPVDASDIGFKIGPRLNAAGRLGTALASEEILSTQNETRASELAEFLHGENAERQQLEKGMVQQALAQVAALQELPAAFVLHSENWHPGVVGLVASRVLERFYRPTLVLGTGAEGKLKGSGRSTHAFDLFGSLNQVRDEFVAFGGHFHAVGLTLEPNKLDWLRTYLDASARAAIGSEDKIQPLDIDGLAQVVSFDQAFLERLETFEPYGIENPRPKWLLSGARIKTIKRIGKSVDANHAKVVLDDGSGENWFTAFDMASQLEALKETKKSINLVIEGRMSFWNGNKRPELRIVDFSQNSV